MNAQELFLSDGRSAGVWYCGKCNYTARTQAEAESCCGDNTCGCGEPCGRRTECDSCSEKRFSARRLAEFQAADLVSEPRGNMVCHGDSFHADLGDLVELLIDDTEDGESASVYVYDTDPVDLAFCADDLVRDALDSGDFHEEAYDDVDPAGVARLQRYLDAWCRKYGARSWHQAKRTLGEVRVDGTGRATLHDHAGDVLRVLDEGRGP